ncbi:MAG TPA: T9SS type A sorting domain-containing protein, partial [Chitinophagaceae bacterium]|nr:T9SS type A sorting domain-containing protein [Chitinophagaceae bacterium]
AKWNDINPKAIALQKWNEDLIIRNTNYKLTTSEGHIDIVCEVNAWDTQYDKTLILNYNGDVLESYDNLRHVLKDTVILCRIFNPDPLTSTGQVYGGIYKDNANANASWMNVAYVDTVVQATYDTNTQLFYLENPWVQIDSLESLDISVVTSPIPEFFFNRSQNGFEDVNAFFHLTNYHNYIASLGYNSYMNQVLQVDSHGQFGADNSVFNRNGGNPNIMFGTGGVDDAEDADVLIHEYSHALSWSANNNGNFSNERAGLDEGIADYFATTYSRIRNTFNWEMMFSWDGHNEFWNGRSANTLNNYPFGGNIYGMGEIWNAAMSGICTDLGTTVTDKLMLEALPFLTDQSTLPEAALYVLQADTALFNGIHSNAICNRFQGKAIFDQNCKPVGIPSNVQQENLRIYNTLAFAQGQDKLSIVLPHEGLWNIRIYTISGQLIYSEQRQQESTFTLSPAQFQSGVYIVHINNNQS